jgi:hypothetical protein
MKTASAQFRSELEPVRHRLEAWRRTRQHREPIPQSIWQAMGRLARVHGLSAVSRVLRVHYYGLRKQLNDSPEPAETKPVGKHTEAAAFVELKRPAAVTSECLIELEDRGAKMTMRLPAGHGSDPVALIQAFWRR